MGEIAEMMLDGTLCEGCGEYMGDGVDDDDTPGFPVRCETCERARLQYEKAETRKRNPRR